MTRSLMVMVIVFTIALFGSKSEAFQVGSDQPQEKEMRITLKIDGVHCSGCAKALTAALEETGLELVEPLEPNQEGPSQLVVICPKNFNLAVAADKVNAAETPHKDDRPPGMFLVLFTELTPETEKDLQTAIEDLKGVDTEATKCDEESDQILVKIAGTDSKFVTEPVKLNVEQIVLAMKDEGIAVELTEPKD